MTLISRRGFIALASGLLVPEPPRVRAYSFLFPELRRRELARFSVFFNGKKIAQAVEYETPPKFEPRGLAMFDGTFAWVTIESMATSWDAIPRGAVIVKDPS